MSFLISLEIISKRERGKKEDERNSPSSHSSIRTSQKQFAQRARPEAAPTHQAQHSDIDAVLVQTLRDSLAERSDLRIALLWGVPRLIAQLIQFLMVSLKSNTAVK
jgi:hypothetical protein